MSEQVKPGYKLTELGVIPEDWKVVCVGDLLRQGPTNGYSGRTTESRSGTPTLSLSATSSGRLVLNSETVKYLERRIGRQAELWLRPGDVLVQRSNTIDLVGTTAVYTGPINAYVYPDLMMRLRFSSPLVGLLFWRFANSEVGRRYFVKVAASSTGSMPKLTGDKLRTMPIPLPQSNYESEAIANALSDADDQVESLEQLVAKKRRIKQGAMQELLTGRKRLPGFTGEWEVKRFGDLFTPLRNASNSRSELNERGEVGYIHYGDIHTHPTAFMQAASLTSYISRDEVVSVPRLADGDLLMADASEDTSAIGKAVEIGGVNGREVVGGLHTMVLRGDKRRLADGFKGYLQFLPKVRSALVRLATGVSVYGITKSGVKAIEVALPEVAEQSAIAAILSDMDAEIAAIETKLAKARQIKQGMMQELLTGRIRLIQPGKTDATPKGHNWAFNEAVVVSVLAKTFGSEQYPLGRKRYQKLSYLMHRHHERRVEGYLKKAAGPYNPATRYKGPEAIAVKNGYVRPHKRDQFSGFVADEKIAEAESYFRKWYGDDVLAWLEQFRLKKNDELELLATVDMAVEDLRREGKAVDLAAVKRVIRDHPEWEAKLEREVFSDLNIARAIQQCGQLFGPAGQS